MQSNQGPHLQVDHRQFNQNTQLPRSRAQSPAINTLSVYQEQIQRVASQQQLAFCQKKLKESQIDLEAEQARSCKLENERAYFQRCFQDTSTELRQQNQKLADVNGELHSTCTVLKHAEKRGQEQWAAVISLADLLHCQTSNDGGQINVARLTMEKETFRDESVQLKHSLAEREIALHKTQMELHDMQTQIADQNTRCAANFSAEQAKNEQLERILGSWTIKCNNLEGHVSELHAYLDRKEKELQDLRTQVNSSRNRPLIGPVPSKWNRKRREDATSTIES